MVTLCVLVRSRIVRACDAMLQRWSLRQHDWPVDVVVQWSVCTRILLCVGVRVGDGVDLSTGMVQSWQRGSVYCVPGRDIWCNFGSDGCTV